MIEQNPARRRPRAAPRAADGARHLRRHERPCAPQLLPALYNLAHDGVLPGRFHLRGVTSGPLSGEEFGAMADEAVRTFSQAGT